MKPLVHGGDWLDPHGIMDFPEDVDIIMAVDVEPTRKELRPGTHWVFCNFFEPRATRISNAYTIQYKDKFELILTLDPQVIEQCKQARMFLFGMTWIRREDWDICQKDKKFLLTMICGGKNLAQGHSIRHEIWRRQDEIKTPKTFYRSSQSQPPGFEKNPVVSSDLPGKWIAFNGAMYHVCVENANDTNYFSEKLMDCFVTKTVPIYWGCENIHDYFDHQGMIICSGPNHMMYEINNLTEAKYHKMMPYIEENYKRAQQFVRPMAERVQEYVYNFLFKMNPFWKPKDAVLPRSV